jgi:hypothetical protein
MDEAISNLAVSGPKVAARFIVACGEAFNAFDQALIDVQGKVSDDEFRQLKQAVGRVVGLEMYDLRLRLKSLYPQLDVEDVRQLAHLYEGGF